MRYYLQWRQDPTSIVFASIAEFMIGCQMLDEAIEVCMTGLTHHPNFIMGRVVLAKAYLKKGEKALAQAELRRVLRHHPEQRNAKELLEKIQTREAVDAVLDKKPDLTKTLSENIQTELGTSVLPIRPTKNPHYAENWETITMAKIYASQGHISKAKQVYQNILARDPDNRAAVEGLHQLP